jgi:F-type H+-transporting ATPase subunit delta
MSEPTATQQTEHVETDVGSMRVARIYAEALLDAANQRHEADAVLEELRALVEDVLQAKPALAAFFTNKAVGHDHLADVLNKVFLNRVSDTLANFLMVLNDHDRLDLLRPILAAYKDLNNERNRRMIVQVRSATPLLDHQRERLLQELRQAFQHEPVLETQIDPDLLGGLVVRVGDWLYDASVYTRLETLSNQLSERSQHEIQSGRDRFGS